MVAGGLLLTGFAGQAQHQSLANSTVVEHTENEEDSSKNEVRSLQDFLRSGHFGGHLRTYFMATVNKAELNDYATYGVSGLVEYETANFKGFEMGLSGLFVFNLWSATPLDRIEPLTGQYSRYEVQLYDVRDPDNETDLDRLDQLYLRYRFGNSFLMFGKMGIHTPLINMQDTRMKPYVLEGFWSELRPFKKWQFHAGFFYKASVRSTTEWVSAQESIGIYGTGFTPDGQPSAYAEHLRTDGVGVLGATFRDHYHQTQLWHYWIDNISHNSFLQIDQKFPLRNNIRLLLGLQVLRQSTIAEGGNPDSQKAYRPAGQENYVYCGQLGAEHEDWRFTLSYFQADKNGRFVFPREWGREQFYTTVSRGRMEGFGNVQNLMSSFFYHPAPAWNIRLDLGRIYAPQHENYRFNKYQNISYDQFNFDLRYRPQKGVFEGLELRFLYVHKRARRDYGQDLAPLYYTADFHHFNLITNLVF